MSIKACCVTGTVLCLPGKVIVNRAGRAASGCIAFAAFLVFMFFSHLIMEQVDK